MNGRKTSPAGGDLLQALKGEPLSSEFSTDGSLVSVSAVQKGLLPGRRFMCKSNAFVVG